MEYNRNYFKRAKLQVTHEISGNIFRWCLDSNSEQRSFRGGTGTTMGFA